MARLVIKRNKWYGNDWINQKLLLDGKNIGYIGEGKTLVIEEVTPGKHQLLAKTILMRSNKFDFEVKNNDDEIFFELKYNYSKSKYSFFLFLFSFLNYFLLKYGTQYIVHLFRLPEYYILIFIIPFSIILYFVLGYIFFNNKFLKIDFVDNQQIIAHP